MTNQPEEFNRLSSAQLDKLDEVATPPSTSDVNKKATSGNTKEHHISPLPSKETGRETMTNSVSFEQIVSEIRTAKNLVRRRAGGETEPLTSEKVAKNVEEFLDWVRGNAASKVKSISPSQYMVEFKRFFARLPSQPLLISDLNKAFRTEGLLPDGWVHREVKKQVSESPAWSVVETREDLTREIAKAKWGFKAPGQGEGQKKTTIESGELQRRVDDAFTQLVVGQGVNQDRRILVQRDIAQILPFSKGFFNAFVRVAKKEGLWVSVDGESNKGALLAVRPEKLTPEEQKKRALHERASRAKTPEEFVALIHDVEAIRIRGNQDETAKRSGTLFAHRIKELFEEIRDGRLFMGINTREEKIALTEESAKIFDGAGQEYLKEAFERILYALPEIRDIYSERENTKKEGKVLRTLDRAEIEKIVQDYFASVSTRASLLEKLKRFSSSSVEGSAQRLPESRRSRLVSAMQREFLKATTLFLDSPAFQNKEEEVKKREVGTFLGTVSVVAVRAIFKRVLEHELFRGKSTSSDVPIQKNAKPEQQKSAEASKSTLEQEPRAEKAESLASEFTNYFGKGTTWPELLKKIGDMPHSAELRKMRGVPMLEKLSGALWEQVLDFSVAFEENKSDMSSKELLVLGEEFITTNKIPAGCRSVIRAIVHADILKKLQSDLQGEASATVAPDAPETASVPAGALEAVSSVPSASDSSNESDATISVTTPESSDTELANFRARFRR